VFESQKLELKSFAQVQTIQLIIAKMLRNILHFSKRFKYLRINIFTLSHK
jgi:hypothetical protein